MKNNSAKLVKEQLAIGTVGGGKDKTVVNYATIKRAALTLRALNHILRKKILEVIESKDKITVTEIYAKLKIEQSVASQHLAILRKANIVITHREGKFIHYSVNRKRVAEIVELARGLAQ